MATIEEEDDAPLTESEVLEVLEEAAALSTIFEEDSGQLNASVFNTGGPVTAADSQGATAIDQIHTRLRTTQLEATNFVFGGGTISSFVEVLGQLTANTATIEGSMVVGDNITIQGETKIVESSTAANFRALDDTGFFVNFDRLAANVRPSIEFRLGENVITTAFLMFEDSQVTLRVTTLNAVFIDVKLNQSLLTTDNVTFDSILANTAFTAPEFRATNRIGLVINFDRKNDIVAPAIQFNLGDDAGATGLLRF